MESTEEGKDGEPATTPGGELEQPIPLPAEAVSLEEAAAAFRYPPILAFASSLSSGGRATFFIMAQGSEDEESAVAVHWQWKAHSRGYNPAIEVENRGFVVEARAHPPGKNNFHMGPLDGDKVLRVRGHEAYMKETYVALDADERREWRSQGQRDLRMIHWWVQTRDVGRFVAWQVFNNSRTFSEEETIRILDAMREVSP